MPTYTTASIELTRLLLFSFYCKQESKKTNNRRVKRKRLRGRLSLIMILKKLEKQVIIK